jgi:hypothetical protein
VVGNRARRRCGLASQLFQSDDPRKVLAIIDQIDTLEDAMERAGYGRSLGKMRPVNEARFVARWHLGRLLKKFERRSGVRTDLVSGRDKVGYRTYLRDIGLDKSRANEAERIGAIPTEKLLRTDLIAATSMSQPKRRPASDRGVEDIHNAPVFSIVGGL